MMNGHAAKFRETLDRYYEHRKQREREMGWWLVGFSLIQSLRAGIVTTLAAAVYSLIVGHWDVFAPPITFAAAIVLLAIVGPVLAWRKIQQA